MSSFVRRLRKYDRGWGCGSKSLSQKLENTVVQVDAKVNRTVAFTRSIPADFIRPRLLEGWLALTRGNYLRNIQVSILLNQS